MKKRFNLFFILFALFIPYIHSQNVYINVKGDNLKNKEIRLTEISDRISLSEKLLTKQNTGENVTQADINVTLDGIKEVALKVNMREYHFIVVPGNKYFINILPYNDSVYSFAFKEVLPAVISMEKDDKINFPVNETDSLLNDYISDNYRMLTVKNTEAVDGIMLLEKDLLAKYTDNEYVSSYIKYEFASVYYGLGIISKKKIKEDLFKNSPVLYDNIGYTDCFNTVFSHYFSQGYKYISLSDIEKWLDAGNYNAFNDALGRDHILENEIFREFVFLQGMRDAFTRGLFSRERILAMIDIFASQTKFPEHRSIAKNLKEYLSSKTLSGQKIRELKVKNIDGDIVSIHDYLNKPLVVCLVQLDCTACLKELETIHFYYDSIKDNCNILAVSLDNSFERMYNFVRNSSTGSKYRFPFVHFDFNWEIADEYRLHFFPTFVLINTDGTILQNPMESPSRNGLKRFFNKNNS